MHNMPKLNVLIKKGLFLVVCIVILSSCSQKETSKTLTISVAASLKESMLEIEKLYQEVNPMVQLNFNFGGSGALAQQIRQGAPVDVFFSAAKEPFEALEKEQRIGESSDLLGNELVLIMHNDTEKSIDDFKQLSSNLLDTLALGTVETVPAGQYAKELLEHLNIWDELENRVVYAKDVREVLAYVETGNADAGVVYQTDAMSSGKVRVMATADASLHTPIVYTVGTIANTKLVEEADQFFRFLQTDEAKQVFIKHGFTVQ